MESGLDEIVGVVVQLPGKTSYVVHMNSSNHRAPEFDNIHDALSYAEGESRG